MTVINKHSLYMVQILIISYAVQRPEKNAENSVI